MKGLHDFEEFVLKIIIISNKLKKKLKINQKRILKLIQNFHK